MGIYLSNEVFVSCCILFYIIVIMELIKIFFFSGRFDQILSKQNKAIR